MYVCMYVCMYVFIYPVRIKYKVCRNIVVTRTTTSVISLDKI